EPAVAVIGERLVLDVRLPAALPVHGVQERVDQDVAAVNAELAQEPLEALPGLTHEDSASDRFVLSRVLTDDQDTSGAVEPAPMEDRSPLRPERIGRGDVVAGIGLHQ